MRRFRSILFSPLGESNNAPAARRVGDLAGRNGASLTFFGVVAEPSRFERFTHRDDFYDTVLEAECKSLGAKLDRWAAKTGDTAAETRVEVGNLAVSIIQRVLTAGHDLLIVTTDDDDEDQATIKRLLRKCPCPVWVIRPTRARVQRVLAAVNPSPDEVELNHNILELASSMVALYGGELHVVHGWELHGEETMRRSAFLNTPPSELRALLENEERSHREALGELLATPGLQEHPWLAHLEKGPAPEVVCDAVRKHKVNLLVMGTVARTGISGLIMGSTAERVLNNVRCSVVAVKPPGFVSPIERPAK